MYSLDLALTVYSKQKSDYVSSEGVIPPAVSASAAATISQADRDRASREIVDFAETTLKAFIKAEQRHKTRPTSALERISRVDVCVWVDSNHRPHYYVNEVERGLLVWLGLGSSANVAHTRNALVDAFGELIMSLKRYHNL